MRMVTTLLAYLLNKNNFQLKHSEKTQKVFVWLVYAYIKTLNFLKNQQAFPNHKHSCIK